MNIESIRKDFPILERKVHDKPLVYFDNAATTQKPKQVIDSVNDFYSNYNANVHRGLHALSEEASEAYEKAHEKVGNFINSEWDEIVFTKNTTESLNILAYSLGLDLKKDDEVLITKMEHHANFVPWQYLGKKLGFKVKYVDITKDGELDMQSFDSLLTNKTKIVSVIHVSNTLGTINPVKELIEKAHDKNALAIVDGAQSIPHMEIDVKDLNCDFFAFSGHKMLAPTGTGGLFGKKEAFEEMNPFLFGGEMISSVSVEKTEWNMLPWKFEAGTPHVAGGIGIGAAVDYLNKIGMDKILKHEHKLVEYALNALKDVKGIQLYGPKTDKRAGVISFNIADIHPHDVASVLDTHGIAVRAGAHCTHPLLHALGVEHTVRASFYIYNTEKEIDVLIDALNDAVKIFGV